MADGYLLELLKRLTATCQSLTPSAEVAWAPATRSIFPYWLIHIANRQTETVYGEEFERHRRFIDLYYLVGNSTQGFTDAQTSQLADVLESFDARFTRGQLLLNAEFPTAPLWLDSADVFLLNDSGIASFALGGTGQRQVGIRFRLSVPIVRAWY